ncbi:MAG: hypothetical protein M3Q82_10060 [Actinomycetota bacterium]|nr:hypothetical protein [Actinomycetota bacterium]
MSDAMPFNQHFQARTTFPLVEVLDTEKCPDFFVAVRNRLRPGDKIEVTRFRTDDWSDQATQELIEIAFLRVIKSGARIEYVHEQEILTLEQEGQRGVTVTRRGTLWYVKRDGARIEGARFNTEIEANEFAEALRKELKKAA